MSRPLSVVAFGMVTAVGNSGPASAAALRAGIRGVAEANLWDPTAGEYLAAGRPTLPQWWEGPTMLPELVAPPIEECTAAAEKRFGVSARDVPVLVLIPPPTRPCRSPTLDEEMPTALSHKLGRALAPGSSLVASGSTGIVADLGKARDLIAKPGPRLCVIAGVESFLRQAIVEAYLERRRLLTADNSNGFSPGEAAAAILVTDRPCDGPSLRLRGIGWAHDASGAGGDARHPVTGNGLTQAIRQALEGAGLEHHAIDLRISDANGEHFKFKEAAMATARLDRLRPRGSAPRRYGYLDHWHPIEYLGEVGTAIFPLMLGWALHGAAYGYLHGPRLLLHAGEESGERAAIVAEAVTGAQGGRT